MGLDMRGGTEKEPEVFYWRNNHDLNKILILQYEKKHGPLEEAYYKLEVDYEVLHHLERDIVFRRDDILKDFIFECSEVKGCVLSNGDDIRILMSMFDDYQRTMRHLSDTADFYWWARERLFDDEKVFIEADW